MDADVSTCTVADLDRGARLEEAIIEPCVEAERDGVAGEPVAVDRHFELRAQGSESLDMIRVLVCDENAGEAFRRAAEAGEALTDLATAEAGINQQPHVGGFEIGAIAARTAAEDGETNRHEATLRTASGSSKIKFQVPSPRQAPSSVPMSGPRSERLAARFANWDLKIPWNLELGVWNFEVAPVVWEIASCAASLPAIKRTLSRYYSTFALERGGNGPKFGAWHRVYICRSA